MVTCLGALRRHEVRPAPDWVAGSSGGRWHAAGACWPSGDSTRQPGPTRAPNHDPAETRGPGVQGRRDDRGRAGTERWWRSTRSLQEDGARKANQRGLTHVRTPGTLRSAGQTPSSLLVAPGLLAAAQGLTLSRSPRRRQPASPSLPRHEPPHAIEDGGPTIPPSRRLARRTDPTQS